ncbi:MAG: lytic transglycosylase domain-containing protein [Synergistaceae bacterium]|nr:lytic transglycosylase domain-containing protein [Synergistaceae bacterium]
MTTLISLVVFSATACAGSEMENAFWLRDWRTMDEIYSASLAQDVSTSSPSISPREKSIYVNGLWLQGRYEEGVIILESIQQDYPNDLRAYADMLYILGLERTGKKHDAFERGKAVWESYPPDSLKYYLAYAMGRLSRDLEMKDESLMWFRRMNEFAPDPKRAIPALSQIIETGEATAEEAASMLLNSPSNVRALAILAATDPARAGGLVAYALGHGAYSARDYKEAMRQFDLASKDVTIGEDARYYAAYSAYREKRDDTAFKLWSEIVLTGFEYPQRSVQRLESLAERARKSDIINTFKKAAEARAEDYPDVAADALAALIRMGDAASAREAEKQLFSVYPSNSQAATIRWERGWKAWKERKYREAYDQWHAGYSPMLTNSELASRMLYWQMRALEKLNSPVAAERVKTQLVATWPAEYHTFLVSRDGGIKQAQAPEKFLAPSDLMDWGFFTYVRLEGANITASNVTSADVPTLYRTTRLALWEDEYTSAVRTFMVMRRVFPSEDMASSELLKLAYPRAFDREVMAASERTGLPSSTIWGVMRQESLYEPDVSSSAGAYGLMQLMPATAREEARKMSMPDDAYLRPADNVMLGANHLAGLFARFKELPLAFAAYNAGGSRVRDWTKNPVTDMAEWVESIPFRETRGFVKAVMRNIQVYRQIYSEGD